jgi:hypothetical protein
MMMGRSAAHHHDRCHCRRRQKLAHRNPPVCKL